VGKEANAYAVSFSFMFMFKKRCQKRDVDYACMVVCKQAGSSPGRGVCSNEMASHARNSGVLGLDNFFTS